MSFDLDFQGHWRSRSGQWPRLTYHGDLTQILCLEVPWGAEFEFDIIFQHRDFIFAAVEAAVSFSKSLGPADRLEN